MVPNSPYPNIVASSGFLGFRIPMNQFGTVGLAMYVRFGTQFEQFVGYRRLCFEGLRQDLYFLIVGFWLLSRTSEFMQVWVDRISSRRTFIQQNPAMRHLARMFDTHTSSHFVRRIKVDLLGL